MTALLPPPAGFWCMQLKYRGDPWRLLVACCLVNITTWRQVSRVIDEFFGRWPGPEEASRADPGDMAAVIRPLGLSNVRSRKLIRMSAEWLGEWDDVGQLHGVGKYARDSYLIFVKGRLDVEPTDKVLIAYLESLA